MKIKKIMLVFFVIVLFILGISFALTFSNNSKNFCINGDAGLSANCEIGCCVDRIKIEHNNYPKNLCESQEGVFYSGACENIFICD